MTTQNISLVFGSKSIGVKQSDTNNSTGSKGGFDSIIGGQTRNSKGESGVRDVKAAGKVNVINNSQTGIRKSTVTDDIKAKDIESMNIYIEDGKLRVQLTGSAADNDTAAVDIGSYIEKLRSVISDILNVSDEDIEDVLEQNGMSMLDMLVTQNLQQLFVQLQGMEEFSDILTDDAANNLWTQLSGAVNDLNTMMCRDIQISPEQLAGIIENAMKQSDEPDGGRQADMSAGSKADVADGISDDGTVTDEPVVVVNNETASVNEGDSADGDSRGTDYESIRGDRMLDDASKGGAGESLFSQFMDRIESAADADMSRTISNVHNMREIAGQVIEGVRINVKPDTTGFEIQLNPEHLGKVNVSIQMKDGVAVADFVVKDEMTRAALESQIQTLKDTFEDQGLKVESVEVTVSDFSFKQDDNSWAGEEQDGDSSRRRFRTDDELTAGEDFTVNFDEAENAEEGSINIRA